MSAAWVRQPVGGRKQTAASRASSAMPNTCGSQVHQIALVNEPTLR